MRGEEGGRGGGISGREREGSSEEGEGRIEGAGVR